MLSSIASFLPSALNIGHNNHDLPRPAINPDTEDEDEDAEESYPRDVPAQDRDDSETQRVPRGKDKEKEKDGKLANEVGYGLFSSLG